MYLCRGDRELHLQLLIPACRNSLNATVAGERPTYPRLVYVRGSAWRKQDCYKNLPQLARIAERGIVVAVVEYRDSSMACFPAQVHDAQAAVRFALGGCSSSRQIDCRARHLHRHTLARCLERPAREG